MKRQIVIGIVLFAGVSGVAIADCTNNRVSARNTLAGNTICGARGPDRWQEEHQGTGNGASPLFDFKLGNGHAIDPRKRVGTWLASNGANSTVTYNYTGAGPSASFTYSVFQIGTSNVYSFCDGAKTETGRGRLQTGTGAACTSYATLP